jgi:hypothetical protein
MFAPQNRPHALRPDRQIGIWLLALALAFQSVSAAVIGVTGGQHRHIACTPAEPDLAPTEGFFKAFVHQLLGDGAMAILEARQQLVQAAGASPPSPKDFPVVWTGGIPVDLGADVAAPAATAPEQPVQAQTACHSHPAHTHSGYERHKHTHGDAPSVHIGQADDHSGGSDDASLIHAELPPALEATPLAIQIAFTTADRQAWPVHQQAQPRSWRPAPQERPPRA